MAGKAGCRCHGCILTPLDSEAYCAGGLVAMRTTHGQRRPECGAKFEIETSVAMVASHPIPLMKIMTNYSLEFGVVLRAVCPTQTGLEG